MRFWKKSLQSQLVSSFLFLMLLTIVLVGSIAFFQVRVTLEQTAFESLEAAATIKANQFNQWIDDQRAFTIFLSDSEELRSNVSGLVRSDPELYTTAYQEVEAYLQQTLDNHPDFQELFVLRESDSKIMYSTNPVNEGLYQINATYYKEGRHASFVQNIYPSPETARPTITIATPLTDKDGETQAVLAVHLNLDRLDDIIFKNIGLGTTSEAYLVDRLSTFVSSKRFARGQFNRGVQTQGIDAAIRGQDGAGLYPNYDGIPVLGVYTWIDERDVALLVEVQQDEAFAPARQLAMTILLVGLGASLLLSAGIFFAARRITRPLQELTASAAEVATGNLSRTVLVQTEDEVGALGISFNLMTRRLQEVYANLQRSEEHFRSLIEQSTDVTTIVNRSGVVLYESPSIKNILGYEADYLSGKVLTEFVHPDDLSAFQEAVEQSFDNPTHHLAVEFRFFHADGTWHILEGRGRFLIDMSGESGIVINARDITERKQAEEERARLQEENLRARREFIATVSHELRTPLTPIRGYVDILLLGAGGEINEQQRSFLQTIKDNTIRMSALVDDLLEVGRIEAGRVKLNFEMIDLSSVIAYETRMLQTELDRKEMTLLLDIADDLPGINADKKRVSQVLANLLSNAVKYTYPQGNICVRAFQYNEHFVEIQVEDTGIGLTPEQQEKLFTPFYRADNVMHTEVSGTGLGLSITKSFVELHGGKIWVQSEVNKGSVFAFRLPINPHLDAQLVQVLGNNTMHMLDTAQAPIHLSTEQA